MQIEKVLHSQSLKVRIDDINYGNHLGHDKLVSLLHDARCAWLHSHKLSEIKLGQDGLGWVVANLNVNYRAEAFFADQLTLELGLIKLGNKSVTLAQKVTNQHEEVLATAEVTLVFYDYHQRQAVAAPTVFKALVE